MTFDELAFVCTEAARDLAARNARPVPATVVLPSRDATRVVTLPGFPDDDEGRHGLLVTFANQHITTAATPCWGFVAEAEVGGQDAVIVAYGARQHPPALTAAIIHAEGELGEFEPAEELDPTALPFLHPLQHAVDSLPTQSQSDSSTAGGIDLG